MRPRWSEEKGRGMTKGTEESKCVVAPARVVLKNFWLRDAAGCQVIILAMRVMTQ